MKRWLLLLGLLVLLVVSPLGVPGRAQPIYLPHEDPSLAQGRLDAYHWLLYYSEILNLVVAQDLEGVRRLLEELGQASFPAGMRELMLSFNKCRSPGSIGHP